MRKKRKKIKHTHTEYYGTNISMVLQMRAQTAVCRPCFCFHFLLNPVLRKRKEENEMQFNQSNLDYIQSKQ